MDDKDVRLKVLGIAAANCGTTNSEAIVIHARHFETYVQGPLPELEPVAKPRKKKATTKKK